MPAARHEGESVTVSLAAAPVRDDFRAIVDHCSTALVIQRDEHIIYANHAAADCLDFSSPAELVGQAVEHLFDAPSYATIASNFQKAAPDDDQLFIGELKLRRKSGALIDAEVYHYGVVFNGA